MTFEVRSFEARTVTWWYRLKDEIDFNPDYQRQGQVWDQARQAFLIDSIINDFDIPKLYLADFTYFASALNAKRLRFAVIDGKQRLTALFNFLEDKIPLAPDFTLREEPELELGGLTYSELRRAMPGIAQKVENFNLPVMSVITDEEDTVQELFVRLNSGKPLTAAERRNAMGGVVPGLVREIRSSQFFETCVAFSSRAGSHEQAAAKLLLLAAVGGPVNLKRAQLDDLYERGKVASEVSFLEKATLEVLEITNAMSQAFLPRDVLLRSQGQLPVYFLLFSRGNTRPGIREAIEDFHQLRLHVRHRNAGSMAEMPVDEEEFDLAGQYDRAMRNPNDARSVYEMSSILSFYVNVLHGHSDRIRFTDR